MAGAPIQDLFRQKLLSCYWRFGPGWGEAKTDRFTFLADGGIGNYDHPNERRWALNNGRLEIFDFSGALMWVAASRYVEDSLFCIGLKTPRDANAAFVLKEGPALPAAAPVAVAAPVGALSPADFLFPKDLAVTPVKLERVRLVGSCMTALYHEQFQRAVPETAFEYVVFNYAGEIAPPGQKFDLQYVQIPLRSVLTDRVVWAGRFGEEGFFEEVFRTGCEVIDAMLASALAHVESHGLMTLVSNFIVPQMSVTTHLFGRYGARDLAGLVRRLNDYLAAVLLRYKNVYLADVNGIAESIGKQYVLDDMINFYGHNGAFFREWVRYERPARIEAIPDMENFYQSKRLEFVQAVWDQILATVRTAAQVDQVKAVVFDLDNTLWRGQLAEDFRDGAEWPKPDGWPIGLWEAVHHLRARGILCAVCSKNDEEVVRKMWSRAVEPAFVSLDDFVCVKINWRTKAENILEICRELNVRPKSVVFVDDNPVERAAVKAAMPDIRVIGANPYLTRRILLWAPETQVAVLTDESAAREEMVRGQIVRETERKSLTREQFLDSLQCRVVFLAVRGADDAAFGRVVELVNKTNQFNTTGKRWSHAEVAAFAAEGGDVLALRVKDRFTDYGLVGVLFCRDGEILQFVMSCRVLGMEVEVYAVAHAVMVMRAKRGGAVTAALVETADNAPCRDVFARSGFVDVGGGRFELGEGVMPVIPGHVREEK